MAPASNGAMAKIQCQGSRSPQLPNLVFAFPYLQNFINFHPGVLKYSSLVVLTLQNAVLIVLMRYTRVRGGEMYLATTAVVMAELFKCSTCLVIIFFQEGKSLTRWSTHLYENTIMQPMDCLKVSVPSIIYTLQNNLLYLAVSNLEAATYQVTYQLKILTTAMFMVIMLHKPVSRMQWLALFLLFVGVAVVQLQPHDSKVSDKINVEQNPLVGLIAVVVSCLMSGFAGVYFEKILKGTPQTIWLRNVQLGSIGVVIGLLTMLASDGEKVRDKGFFQGYDWLVWALICLQSIGGLMVAIVVKYADNILKGFACSVAIIISCVASIYMFDFKLSIEFNIGATLVILAVYMYNKFIPAPPELKPQEKV